LLIPIQGDEICPGDQTVEDRGNPPETLEVLLGGTADLHFEKAETVAQDVILESHGKVVPDFVLPGWIGRIKRIQQPDGVADEKVRERLFPGPGEEVFITQFRMDIGGLNAEEILPENSGEVLTGEFPHGIDQGPFKEGRSEGGDEGIQTLFLPRAETLGIGLPPNCPHGSGIFPGFRI